jgi:DNA invertase Pin-like site-specific DNA recombinase
MNGWTNLKYVEDVVSGSVALEIRSGGSSMMLALQHGDIIVASKFDRLFRSARDALNMLEEWKKNGIDVHVLDIGVGSIQNGYGKAITALLAVFAEIERDKIRERIKEAKQNGRKNGKYLGGIGRFGWRVENGVEIEIAEEQDAIRAMMELRAERKWSHQRIANHLKTSMSVDVSYSTVRNILKRNNSNGC